MRKSIYVSRKSIGKIHKGYLGVEYTVEETLELGPFED
jgi:DNA transposition AAA+ family ATPase